LSALNFRKMCRLFLYTSF